MLLIYSCEREFLSAYTLHVFFVHTFEQMVNKSFMENPPSSFVYLTIFFVDHLMEGLELMAEGRVDTPTHGFGLTKLKSKNSFVS